MRNPYLEKVVVHIGAGEAGERLQKAQRVLEMVTGQKPSITYAKRTIRDLGIRSGQPIGCRVTLRGPRADDFLKRALWVKENRISLYSFTPEGNFSFGIADYTDFQGMKYDPEIGVFGMDVNVCLARRGHRVAVRQVARRKLPARQKLTLTESVSFLNEKYGLQVVE
ncbi:MAG: 50S ribosomal protein L5 [Methanomassiliicoccales archaeon]